jgi:hypothetical protein
LFPYANESESGDTGLPDICGSDDGSWSVVWTSLLPPELELTLDEGGLDDEDGDTEFPSDMRLLENAALLSDAMSCAGDGGVGGPGAVAGCGSDSILRMCAGRFVWPCIGGDTAPALEGEVGDGVDTTGPEACRYSC